MAQNSNGHICISLNSALVVLKRLKQLDYGTNYVHGDWNSSGIEIISSIKNSYTDNRDAELDPEQYLMQVLYR